MPDGELPETEYDGLADVYDVWAESDLEAQPSLSFYVNLATSEPGEVVELGVGTGRIALEIARRGKSLLGVDVAARMLAECRRKAKALGALDRLRLIQAD